MGWALLRSLLRRHRRGLTLGVLAGLGWTAARVSVPALVRTAIDRGVVDGEDLALWCGLVAVAGLVAAGFTGLRRWSAFKEARRLEADLRARLQRHLLGLDAGWHDRSSVGDLMSRANTDIAQIQGFVTMVPITISNIATCVSVAVVLLVLDPVLALLALAVLPLVNVVATRFSVRLQPIAAGIQRESAQLASVVEETVSGIRVVKGFGAEGVQSGRLRTEADDVLRESLAAVRMRARYLPVMDGLPGLGLIAVLGYGGHQVIEGTLTIGELVAFNVYVGLLLWPLRMIGMVVAQAQRAAVSATRVAEVLDAAPAVTDPASPRRLPPATAAGSALCFDAVAFAYGPDAPLVLDGLDLEVAPGESVAIVGATGSGKSTLARLLVRFYDVTAGAVRLDGVDVRELTLADLRRAVAIVPEETFLFSDTLRANLAFARPEATDGELAAAARLAGALDFVEALPEGWDTVVGERGWSLSGGQRQRIAIARALLADPRVLVLDDATSAVDPTKEHEIRDALATAMRGRTTLVIAHRPATVALADRVVLLDGGRIAASGTHAELLATSARYREVLDAEAPAVADHLVAD